MEIKNLYKEKQNTTVENCLIKTNENKTINSNNELLVEHYITVYLNEKQLMTLVCTGSNLVELVVGRLISENIINKIDDIEKIYICEYGQRARVYLKNDINPFSDLIESNDVQSCCSDNKSYFKNKKVPDRLNKKIEVTDDDVFFLAKTFSSDSKIHKTTSGTHSAYLYYEKKIIVSFEDIGRHNAIDKIIGYIYLNNFEPEKSIIFTTGRVPVDMARKMIYAKIGAVVSKSVPTYDAVELAKQYNLTLICRAWQDSYDLYNMSI